MDEQSAGLSTEAVQLTGIIPSHVFFGSAFFCHDISDQQAHLSFSIVVTFRKWIIPITDRHEVSNFGALVRRTKDLHQLRASLEL